MASMNHERAGRRSQRGEGGYVILYVTILGLLAMGLWGLAWRATHDTIRTEKFEVRRAVRSEGVAAALAEGLLLLETGRPPSDPFQCVKTVANGTDSYACTLTYTSQGDQDHWEVTSRIATPDELQNLSPAPGTF